jgi:hypothetical protein
MFLGDANLEPAAPAAWRIFEVSLYLVGALLAGAILLQIIKSQRSRLRTPSVMLSDQLSEFRAAYERGEMSKEDFDRVHEVLMGRLQKSVHDSPSATDAVAPSRTAAPEPGKNGESGERGQKPP